MKHELVQGMCHFILETSCTTKQPENNTADKTFLFSLRKTENNFHFCYLSFDHHPTSGSPSSGPLQRLPTTPGNYLSPHPCHSGNIIHLYIQQLSFCS